MLLFDKDLESFPGLSFNLVPIAQSYCLTRDWTKMSTRCQLVSFSGGTKIKKYVRSERMAINSWWFIWVLFKPFKKWDFYVNPPLCDHFFLCPVAQSCQTGSTALPTCGHCPLDNFQKRIYNIFGNVLLQFLNALVTALLLKWKSVLFLVGL